MSGTLLAVEAIEGGAHLTATPGGGIGRQASMREDVLEVWAESISDFRPDADCKCAGGSIGHISDRDRAAICLCESTQELT